MSAVRKFIRAVRGTGTEPTGYRAGQCNINHRSRRTRRLYALVSAVAAVAVVTAVLAGWLPRDAALAAFVPLSLAFENWLQARHSFCAWLAMLGRQTADSTGSASQRVDAATDRRTDRLHALRLTVAAQTLAVLTTLALYGALGWLA